MADRQGSQSPYVDVCPLVKRWGVTTTAENIRARDIRVIAAAWRHHGLARQMMIQADERPAEWGVAVLDRMLPR